MAHALLRRQLKEVLPAPLAPSVNGGPWALGRRLVCLVLLNWPQRRAGEAEASAL